MSEIKVKIVDDQEAKGVQQVEAELLEKHNEKLNEENTTAEVDAVSEPETDTQVEDGIKDTDVLSFIKEKYDREFNSIDDMFTDNSGANEELPQDVADFYKYKQDTGRGIDDYVKLNQDFNEADPNEVLANYWADTKPHLDNEDIEFELDDNFGYNEEDDDDRDIKQKKIAKKEELAKAIKYFDDQKSQYQNPVESTGLGLSEDEQSNYDAYKKNVQDQETMNKQNEDRSKYFSKKTDELFNDKFEGFKFKIADNDFVYKPAEAEKLKETQSNINNFVNMHLNEDGYLKDVNAYHKSLAIAMNPESFANYFYEQGKSHAITTSAKQAKNIDMAIRSAPETSTKGGVKIKAIPTSHGNGLRIRSKK